MTIKEIAELCGVDQSTAWRWAQEPACKMQAGLTEKLTEAGHGKSADFTLGETLAIIGEGGGNKTLASLLAENAATKNALAVQSEAMAKIANLPERFEKFRGQTIEAVKELKARADALLENTVSKAVADVKEYLLTEHKPSAHEAQLADLKRYLSLTIVATGDKRDKIDLFRLYPGYEAKFANPIPKDAFAAEIMLMYPQIKCRGGVFSGCRFDY
jgi:hypothetical protein